MLLAIWCWLNEHPERWLPLVGALASVAADAIKIRWPGSARIIDAMVHLVPNLPAAYRAIRGATCSSDARSKPEDQP